MVFDVHKDVVFAGFGDEMLVLGEVLDRRFCDQDVNAATDGVKSDRIVRCVRGEDCDGITRGERLNGYFVGFWVTRGGV